MWRGPLDSPHMEASESNTPWEVGYILEMQGISKYHAPFNSIWDSLTISIQFDAILNARRHDFYTMSEDL